MSGLGEFIAAHGAASWTTVGVVLLIVEVLAISGFFLSFAVSAFLVAAAIALHILPALSLWTILLFAAMGVALIPVARKLLRRYVDRTPDINRY